MTLRRSATACVCVLLFCALASSAGAGGRLLATGGVNQIEGAGGGGLVPWAVITGNGTEDEIGAAAFATGVFVDEFQLGSYGVAVGLYDRVEFSYARQRFEVRPLDEFLEQDIFGVKLRAFGDLVYGQWPVVSIGAQFKHNLDFQTPEFLGAKDDFGVDIYLSTTRLFLDALLGRNVLLNATVRATKANELGLLGFGGDGASGYDFVFEGSAAVFLTRRVALGYEFRQKEGQLEVVEDDHWHDVFVAFFPMEHLSFVASYVYLGEIAGFEQQDGGYLSLQGNF